MSLRKISSGHIEQRGFFLRKWYFFTTKTKHFVLLDHKYQEAAARRASVGAVEIGREAERVLWWTTSGLFWADPELSDEDVALLIWDRQRRQDSRLDRLRKIRDRSEEIEFARRERIPDEVRAFVWERDAGRCVKCGSEDDLQFDHVIPVAKGGGNVAENVQILCGDCNRQKSDSIV